MLLARPLSVARASSRLVIPEAYEHQDRPTVGELVATGPLAVGFVVGEVLLWRPSAGHQYELPDGSQVFLLTPDEILAKLRCSPNGDTPTPGATA
jgi:hypothetical protein